MASTQEAKLEKLPVDVLVYIDGSGTMAPALAAVEQNIDQNFAQKMGASALDYRVIMMTTSKIPQNPADPSRWYYYENLGGSGALHENLLGWYNLSAAGNKPPGGYSDWVRDESFKVFLVISDTSSGPTMDGATFDQKLLALQPARFGTADARKYRYHAIVGLQENDPPSAPWPPSAPVVGTTCTGYNGALAPGEKAQEVAILTGGLRFPLCQFDKYDVVFSTIAEGIAQTTPIDCNFAVPKTPDGKLIDPNTILLSYTPGSGQEQTFSQAKDLFVCKPGQFYIEEETVKLCPETCQIVQADAAAKIDLTYGCDVGFKP